MRATVRKVSWRSRLGIVLAAGLLGGVALIGVWLVRSAPVPPDTPVTQLHHIHGLAVDPQDSRILYLATHGGLLRFVEEKRWELIGEDRSDLMGFTLDPQSGLLYASGHPDHPGRGPNPLGVRVSRDGGRTWTPLALAGQADFHAMTFSPGEGALYGWNGMGVPGLYRISVRDGTWTRLPEAAGLPEVFSLAAHPSKPGTLLAGTRAGLLVSRDGGRTWTAVALGTPGSLVPVTAVAAHPRFLYAYAVHPRLGFLKSRDGGRTWTPTGFFLGDQDAVAVIAPSPSRPEVLYLSTFTSDLYTSTDGGARWRPLARRGQPIVP